MDLVQLIKRNENEDPKVSVLGAMEEIKKVAVEAILLFVDKEIVEVMVQQVILCNLPNLGSKVFFLAKKLCLVPLIFFVIFVLFYRSK